MSARLLRGLLPLAAVSLLLGACSTSTTALESAVDDEPGVTRVSVNESDDGDDDIPFARIAKHVTVWMDTDASIDEVMAVFDRYDNDIDDGDVGSIDVILDGPKRATLSSGENIHVTRQMVEDLVDAQHDDTVTEYRREAYPVMASVYLILAPAGFDELVTAADRYRDAEDIELVEVASGDFLLVRDEANEDLRVTAAREEVVRMVGSRFQLRGADVSGRGPLELIVGPVDEAAVRRLVERADLGLAGNVIVETLTRDVS